MPSRSAKGMLLGLFATIVWGCQYSTNRFIFGTAVEELDPYLMDLVKILTGALSLIPFLFWDGGWRKTVCSLRHDFPMMAFLALVGIAGEGLLIFYAGKFITAARSSLLANMSPVFTVILAALWTRKMPGWGKWLGMILGFAGLAMVLGTQSSDIYDCSGSTLPGDVMALTSGLCWAAYTVFGGETSRKYGGVPCTFVMLLLAAVMMTVVCLINRSDFSLHLSWQAWGGILFLGIIATGFSIAFWYIAMGMTDPAALGAYGYLSALIALVLARVLAREQFTWQFLAAFALIMIAIYFMNRPDTPDKEAKRTTV